MSLSFLIQLLSGKFAWHTRRQIFLDTLTGEVECDVYEPAGSSKATILTINGLAPLGQRDPRFERLNRAMTGCGYRVVSPFMKDLCSFQIGTENIRQVRSFIEAALNDSTLCENGRASVFAPSFTGSLCLIVAADPAISDRINSICALGSFGSAPGVIETLICDQNADEYGRQILLLNYLHFSIGRNPEIETALRLSVKDSYFRTNPPELDSFLKTIKPENREFFEKLRIDSEFRTMHWKKIVEEGKKQGHRLDDLSADLVASGIKAAISLIHGKDDTVVPSQESIRFYQTLKQHGKNANLTVTPLISHGDSQNPLKKIHHIPRLIRGFSFFFKNAAI